MNEMLRYIIIISFLFTPTFLKESQFINLPLNLSGNTYSIKLSFESQKSPIIIDLNMEIDFLWIYFNIYISTKSNPIIKENIVLSDNQYYDLIKDTFKIEPSNIVIDNYDIYIVKNFTKTNGEFDSFPLSYRFDNEKNSLIHYLYNHKYINQKSFSFAILDKNPQLYIGGLPEEVERATPYATKCKRDTRHHTWGCFLNKVTTNNRDYDSNEYLFFQSNQHEILAPENFIGFIYDALFEKYIKEQICKYDYQKEQFECQCSIMYKMNTNINFTIDGSVFNFKRWELFEDINKKCIFLIKLNQRNANQWVFGTVFLDKYLTSFNYDDDYILFRSQNPISTIIEKPKSISRIHIVVFIIILSIFGNILISIQKKLIIKYYI